MLPRVFLPSVGIGRLIGYAAFAVALSGPIRAQETGVTGTLPEDLMPGLRPLIESGMRQAPDMIARDINISIAEAQRLYAGYGPMLPSLSGNAQYGEYETAIANSAQNAGLTPGSQTTSKTLGSFYEVDLAQPIFRWGSLRNQLQVQKISVLLSEKDYVLGYLAFANSVRRQYEGLVITKIGLRNSRINLRIRQKAADLANDQLKAGIIAKTTATATQIDLDSTQLAYDRDAQGYDYARHALARLVGLRDIADDSIPLGIPPARYSPASSAALVADLLQTGARDTIQVQLSRLQLAQSDLQYKIARVGLMPNLSAHATINQYNQSQVLNGSVTQTALTNQQYYVRVDWNIFDGFQTRGHKREALLRRRQAERNLDQTTDQILNDAQNSQRGVDIAWRQLQLGERQFDVAHDSYNQQQADFKLGYISQDAADQNEFTYDLALLNEAMARNGFLSSWCDFLSAVAADPVMKQLPASYARAKP
jgi:outer membrane protein TolC